MFQHLSSSGSGFSDDVLCGAPRIRTALLNREVLSRLLQSPRGQDSSVYSPFGDNMVYSLQKNLTSPGPTTMICVVGRSPELPSLSRCARVVGNVEASKSRVQRVGFREIHMRYCQLQTSEASGSVLMRLETAQGLFRKPS